MVVLLLNLKLSCVNIPENCYSTDASFSDFIGSLAAYFKRPLLLVDLSVCLSVCLSVSVCNFDAKYLGN